MAPRGAIINSAKHIPGGARPTPAPQGSGSGPNFGQMSPLTAQLDTGGSTGNGWAYTYGGFLPRPSQDFTQGAFGPFSPILPVPVDAPPEGAERAEPRREEYQVGWNLPVGTPGSEGIKLADFSTLRTLADLYSVARSAIQLRKAEVRGLEWDIMPTSEASKEMRGSHGKMKDFAQRRAEAVKFFRHPDPDYYSWNSWLDAVLEEIFVFDALSILLRPKWGKRQGKGLLGSDLDSLALINGPTIRPLYDINGSYPRPPAPAYQQYLYGVPRTDLMSMITNRDIEQSGLSEAQWRPFRGDQLLYLPMVPRRWTPYGFPPIERALIPVLSGLQKQGYQLDYFREGTVPAVYVSPGGVNANMTPNQIRELQDALNAIAGDPAWKHKIIVLPAESKVMPQKVTQIADQFDEIVMAQVCMAFDVSPMELGIIPKVETAISPGAARAISRSAQTIQERKSTKPLLMFIADIMNGILHNIAGQDDMKFVFEGLHEEDDMETKTKLLVSQIGAGLRSIDEGREELNLQPWGLPETSDPGWATPNGWIPLQEATEARQTGQDVGDLLRLPAKAPRATATIPGAPGTTPPGAPVTPGGAGKPASSAAPSIPQRKPKTPPHARQPQSKRPGAMASGSGTAAPTPAHTAAGASKSEKADITYAVNAELEALARHVRKGRLLSTWEPRHIDQYTIDVISWNMEKGALIDDAIEIAKSMMRRVNLDGEIIEVETPPQTQVPYHNVEGAGGRVYPSHDVTGREIGSGRNDYQLEVPGGTPGATAGGEPPRWESLASNGQDNSMPHARHDVIPISGEDSSWPDRRGRQPAQGGGPRGPQVHTWPEGGHGTGQAPVTGIPGARKGVAGGAPAAEVHAVMSKNFPHKALKWVKDASWTMQIVPLHDIDFDNEQAWAADHQQSKVDRFTQRIKDGDPPRPAIFVKTPEHHRFRIVDGHHRALAYRSLGKPVPAFVGEIPEGDDRWSETHSYQVHQDSDPANKSYPDGQSYIDHTFCPDPEYPRVCRYCGMGKSDPTHNVHRKAKKPIAAGIAVHAGDTGRILMLQRSFDSSDDPAAGFFEFPGGTLEDGEYPFEAAQREWQEETGLELPEGHLSGMWTSTNGIYQGYVWHIDHEDDLDIFGERDEVEDPDGDHREALVWWSPDQIPGNPAVRPELLNDIVKLMEALNSNPATKADGKGSAEVLRQYWSEEAHGGPTQFAYAKDIRWGEPGDFMRCVTQVSEHAGMSDEQAKGFCNLLHHRATGMWTAEHAKEERGK